MKRYDKYFASAILFLALGFIATRSLSSCSINKKCHRLERRIVKNAKYCQMVLQDTITVKDTVYIGTVRKDSTFVMSNSIDTFYLNKDRLHVQIITRDSLIYVEGQCDSIIKYVEKTVYRDKVEASEVKVFWRWLTRFGRRWFWILIIIAVSVIVWKYGKKIPWVRNWLP